MENKIGIKNIIVNVVIVILSAILAILAHAIIPTGTEINVVDFDSIFVRILGFPIIATMYFLLLFTHCAIIINYFGKKSIMPKTQIGLRFGLSFALIYLIGMQEVVVASSPFAVWGIDFVEYQLFMGLSDAIPVFLLSIIIAFFTFKKDNSETPKNKMPKNIIIIFIIMAFYAIVRIIGYKTGIIGSDFKEYLIPSIIWTLLFGITLGFIFVYLKPIYSEMTLSIVKLSVLTIGINWIIFNSFIGLIFKGLMMQMLLRSIIDVASLFIATVLVNKLNIENNNKKNGVRLPIA
jgi:hypothetical protein